MSSQLRTSRKRRSDYETSDSEEEEYAPVRKLRRCQRGTSIKESITNRCKNIWTWISELPLKDYFKEAMYKKTLIYTVPSDMGIEDEEENVIAVEDEDEDDEEIAIIYDTSEISPPCSPSSSAKHEHLGNPSNTSSKLSKNKLSEAASSKKPFNGSNPVSSSTPCVRENRQRMDVNSYFPTRKHQNGLSSCPPFQNTRSRKTNKNGYLSAITNPGVDVEILLDTKAVPEDDSDLEIMSEVVHRVRKSPRSASSKPTQSSHNLEATTSNLSLNESLPNSSVGNGHSFFTAHEVVRLQEKAKYKLLLDKVVTESVYHPVVPRNKRQALEIDLTHDEVGPIVNSEHRQEYLQQPVSDFINEYYKPSKLTSPRKKNSPSLTLEENNDVEILKVEKLPTYKRRPKTTSKFFSQGWIEELKMTISSETERRLQIIADEEQKIERYRMRRDAKIAEENRLREELMNVMLPRVEVEREDEFPALTEEMDSMIDAAINAPPHQVLSSINKVEIRNNDIATLTDLHWLNDNVINCYLTLIVERSKLDNFPSAYSFTTFFYSSLQTRGANHVLRWTRKVDIFSYDILFVPLHLSGGMHWALGVVDNRVKKITYYDSMLSRDKECLHSLRNYVVAEMKDKKKIDIDPETYSIEIAKDIPQQMNGSDCGMFTLKYAEYISRDAPITFTQTQMPYFRRKMIYELLTNQLI